MSLEDSGRQTILKPICRWPGYLDNTVAGGIPSGMGVFESLVKECMEEASITADVVRKYTRCVGSVSYFFRCLSFLSKAELINDSSKDVCWMAST